VFTFVAALFIVMFVLIMVGGFVVWAIREHLAARKYRYLIELHKRIPAEELNPPPITKGMRWRVTYKDGKKEANIVIPATTEGEALREFMKLHGGAKVVNLVKL